MTERTSTRRRVLLILAWLQVANFLVSLVLWLAGRELSGTHVILQALIALLLILSTQRLSRRMNLALWIIVAIYVAGLVWQWSVAR